MADEQQSKFYLYSLGIVAKDKVEDSSEIEVTPIESIPLVMGNLTAEGKAQGTFQDAKGATKRSEATNQATVVAEWIPLSEVTVVNAPDVCAKETVLLYKYADTDKIYWTTFFREPSLRKLEKKIIMCSNVKGNGSYDKKTSYWLQIDTINKFVQIHTSDNDGEAAMYDIIINTKEGSISLIDSKENSIVLDSVGGELTALIRETINAKTKHYNVECEDYNVKCQTALIQASDSVTLDTPVVHMTKDTIVDANALVKQKLTYQGGMSGSSTSGAAAQIAGGVNFTDGELTHEGVNVGYKHHHTGVQPGGGESGDVKR